MGNLLCMDKPLMPMKPNKTTNNTQTTSPPKLCQAESQATPHVSQMASQTSPKTLNAHAQTDKSKINADAPSSQKKDAETQSTGLCYDIDINLNVMQSGDQSVRICTRHKAE
jgi:hypothetical protein